MSNKQKYHDTTSQAITKQFYITTTTTPPKFRRTWSHVMINKCYITIYNGASPSWVRWVKFVAQCHSLRVPVAGGHFGKLMTRLRQRCLDRPPPYFMRRLQSVLNAAARLIFNLRRSDHVSDALISLHWLRVPERIRSKVAVMMYKVLPGTTVMWQWVPDWGSAHAETFSWQRKCHPWYRE